MLKKIALTPPPICGPQDTVEQAVEAMLKTRGGAVLVMEGARLVGIFTERDVLSRVVGQRRSPGSTLLSDVMTSPVLTVSEDTKVEKALLRMVEHHFRHLPLVDSHNQPIGLLSIRRIFEHHLHELKSTNSSLLAYMGIDGIGG